MSNKIFLVIIHYFIGGSSKPPYHMNYTEHCSVGPTNFIRTTTTTSTTSTARMKTEEDF